MYKQLILLLFFVTALSTKSNAQTEMNTHCFFSPMIPGVWVLDDFLSDLSGEDLDVDGQSWEISSGEVSELKGKITLTFYRDGSFTGQARIEEEPENTFGKWKVSANCESIVLTLEEEEEEEVMKIVLLEQKKMVLEMYEDGEKTRIVLVR